MNVRATIEIFSSALARDAAGAGLKPVHAANILATRPEIGFFEIHAENYMNAGGPNRRMLAAIRELYPVSVHGVGLSLGSMAPLDRDHLARLKEVADFADAALVSEHLAWADFSGRAFPDLLPLPYDDDNLRRIAGKIDLVQDFLGRPILIENPATYLRFGVDLFAEPQFLAELCARTGCGLLLDVNNVFVSAVNHGFGAFDYLDAFPHARVGEIHLAGHARACDAKGEFLIDDHGGPVSPEVWALYRHALAKAGPRPTLIEWDNDVPDWADLLAETETARAVLREAREGLPLTPTRSPPAERGGHPVETLKPSAGGALPLPAGEERTGVRGRAAIAPNHWQAAFAAALSNAETPPPSLFTPCDAAARFAVYRNNVAVAEIAALATQFPTVAQLVGDEAFAGLARAFAQKSPPRSPILAEYGAEFPKFVATFLDEHGDGQTPHLPDIARLDWAILTALRAQEAEALPLPTLTHLDPARIGAARARLHPALAIVASDWPLLSLRHPRGDVSDWRGQTILVLRPQDEIALIDLAPGAAAFLRACQAGATLAEAAEAGMAADPDFDFGQTLVALTGAGAFVNFVNEL